MVATATNGSPAANAGARIAGLLSARAGLAPASGPAPYGAIGVNFDQGLPDPDWFPVAEIEAHLMAVLADDGRASLRYYSELGGPSEMQYGYLGLRRAIAEWMARRDGRRVADEGVTLVNGSTDGLAMAVTAFVEAGDGAVVEAASYPHTRHAIAATGAAIRSVPVDDDGLDVDAVRAALEAFVADGIRPKLISTVPTFHAPTGTVLSLDRRRALIELALEWNVMILEDNCYYEFAYDGAPPPTLLALDEHGVVVQSDSFSKYVAPGLRLAWVAGHPTAIAAVTRVRQDFAVSQLLARAMQRYVEAGDLDRHLGALRDHYRTKCDVTATALAKHCAPLVQYRVPTGGFYFWLAVDPRVDWAKVRARLADEAIAVREGAVFFAADATPTQHYVRLSPIQVPLPDIEPAIAAFGAALQSAVKR